MNANAIAIRGESMTGLHADPASVHEMLSALPGLSLTDDLDRLRSMLSELEQQPVKSATLVDCLERFAAPVALLEKQVRQQHIGLALPLSERERILTASLAAIFERIAAGFERALKPLIEEGREPAGFTPRHSSVALHGAT
ncbi:MAG: hypothetical protein LJE84_10020, partial [Gammaproteobacteria bacterium]|nr:hypothetical protein [Gammaproteobacteria bacterium]